MRTLPESQCEPVVENDSECIATVTIGYGLVLFPDGTTGRRPPYGSLLFTFCGRPGGYEPGYVNPQTECEACRWRVREVVAAWRANGRRS